MIYFISNGNGAIKIGFTSDLEQRLSAFRTTMPTLEVIGTMEGSRGHERTLHNELSSSRLTGEWFSDCEHVRKVIDEAIKYGVHEWKPERSNKYVPSEWDDRASQLAEIISEGKSTYQVDEIEEAFSIPKGTLWKLKYRQHREVSAGEYFALLRAAGRVLALKREALEQQVDFVRSLELEDASSHNALLDAERAYQSMTPEIHIGFDPPK
ncbi:hypothetical protein V1290_000028 [Bradyrhizobium sp. AZCC 1578]|uniref:GIY-YIG nuclease family protein n=1 Tax=Bradyrhizobium sp. AZCC 1578 TaxID=3117027 RepID=UPI002FEF7D84